MIHPPRTLRDRVMRVDESLRNVLEELHKQMIEAQGQASLKQAQRELAFRVKETGLHNFRRARQRKDELFPFRL